jgi:hypothetical protein
MTEAKVEMKISSKSMEAAMVARLFKDAMENEDPIVSHFVWIRDDGQKLDLGRPSVHPSFPNKDSALRRLETRIGQWVSGDKPGLDKNAIARLEISGAVPFDFSMESFEKAALGDDGTLVVAVGYSKGVGREPMEAGRVARIKLYGRNGDVVGRRQALLPIKDIIQIQKKERAAQAQRLEKQERQMEEGVDIGLQISQEEDRQWAESSQESSAPWEKPVGLANLSNGAGAERSARPTEPEDESARRARVMMDLALGAVGKNMGQALKAKPLPFAETRLAPKSAREDIESAFDNGSEEVENENEGLPQVADSISGRPHEAPHALLNQEAPPYKPAEPVVAEPVVAAVQVAAPSRSSQVRVEESAAPIDPIFLRAVFPALPEGCDEIHITIDKDRLFAALEALEDHGSLELRLASKGQGSLSLGLCVPSGKLPLLSEFIAAFSKGGVMIKRSVVKAVE